MRQKKNQDAENGLSELLLKIREGDSRAFDSLCEMYAPLIGSLVSSAVERYRRYGSEYEDLRQEAALALYRAAMSYRVEQSEVTFGLYAKICVRNRLISAGRRMIRHCSAQAASAGGAVQVRESALAGSPAMSATPDLSVLSDYERRICLLYVKGYSYARIAKEVGRPEKSVDNAIYRIRRKLRRQINREYMPK